MSDIKQAILNLTKATNTNEVEEIQSLWSGYGKIARYALEGATHNHVIVKNIIFPTNTAHPRGWNTSTSHARKVKSYQVETEWYKSFSQLCNEKCRIPYCFGTESVGEEQVIVLEDLDQAGFPIRRSHLDIEEVKLCLKWLANFHAIFLSSNPIGLWETGTYWHLNTRPEELQAMADSPIKQAANQIDEKLNNCRFKTFVHGDAKVANFCFSEDMTKVSAVDFQYIGGGCGMKDIVYLLGSCLSENECELYEEMLLQTYFKELKIAIQEHNTNIEFEELEEEWRSLYAIAWADFTRFLLGWMPTHPKLNHYSKLQVEKAIKQLSH